MVSKSKKPSAADNVDHPNPYLFSKPIFMTGYACYTAEQIKGMVERSTVPELAALKVQYEAQYRSGTDPNVRTVALLELHLVQHLLGEHAIAGQACLCGQTTAATVAPPAKTAVHGEVTERGWHE
jgi:hypothetical protein